MERRSFLKSIAGGVAALFLPKPKKTEAVEMPWKEERSSVYLIEWNPGPIVHIDLPDKIMRDINLCLRPVTLIVTPDTMAELSEWAALKNNAFGSEKKQLKVTKFMQLPVIVDDSITSPYKIVEKYYG